MKLCWHKWNKWGDPYKSQVDKVEFRQIHIYTKCNKIQTRRVQ